MWGAGPQLSDTLRKETRRKQLGKGIAQGPRVGKHGGQGVGTAGVGSQGNADGLRRGGRRYT